MPATQSYPSPTAAQMGDGAHPFYTSQQQQLPSADELQLSAQLSRNVAPNMTGNISDGQEMVPSNQPAPDMRQQVSAEELAQGGLDPNHDPSFGDPTPRKRSKVSRACDECRRKKIRCDATSESGDEHCSNCKRVGSRCQFSRVPMKRGPSKGYIKELADRLNTLENQLPVRHPDLQQYAQMSQEGTSPRAMNEFSPPSDGGPSRKRTHSISEGLHNSGYIQAQIQRSGERLPSIGDWSAPDAPRRVTHPGSALHVPHTSQSDTHHNSSNYRSYLSPNGTAQSLWRYGQSGTGRRESISMALESNDVRSDQDHNDTLIEWDDEIVDEYYRIIHPTYPLLPNSTSRLRSRLLECTAVLQGAFLEALYAAVRSSPASTLKPARDTLGARRASELITSFQYDTLASRTKSTNLIYLQTMILMVLEADNHITERGQSGSRRAVWLGAAVSLSNSLKLFINPSRTSYALNDLDSNENLGRRLWCILIILDRWHAVGTSSPRLIPDCNVVIMQQDKILLGEHVYHLHRLSCVVGHLAELFVNPEDLMAPTSNSCSLINNLMAGEMERFRESVEPLIDDMHLVHLAYWHVRLLLKRYTPDVKPLDLFGPADLIARLLNDTNAPFTPLSHHFATLAALTLVDIVDAPDVRDEVLLAIKELQSALDQHRPTHAEDANANTAVATLNTTGWVGAIRDWLAFKMQQQQQQAHQQQQASSSATTTAGNGTSSSAPIQGSLQHLADLAVGGLESENAASSVPAQGGGSGSGSGEKASDAASRRSEATALIRMGYLSALSGMGMGMGSGMENGR